MEKVILKYILKKWKNLSIKDLTKILIIIIIFFTIRFGNMLFTHANKQLEQNREDSHFEYHMDQMKRPP